MSTMALGLNANVYLTSLASVSFFQPGQRLVLWGNGKIACLSYPNLSDVCGPEPRVQLKGHIWRMSQYLGGRGLEGQSGGSRRGRPETWV